ncbi:MAG: aminoacyl-tRNA hydrolase [Bacilli bacterium]|nr:aminoacyl-tRNA hydrolase [Bacilli bacterium]
MKLIVGLGNPGDRYKNTRHNIGFMFLDELKNDLNLEFSLNKQLKSLIAFANINGEKIIFAKPQTFMNLSGEAVLSIVNYYKLEIEDIVIVYDDLDLPSGKIRIRKTGSSGGHKGMSNIIQLLKTSEIKRIRIGIMNNSNIDTIDYVLGKFTIYEEAQIRLTLSKSLEIVKSFIVDSFDDFMNKFNRSGIDE